MRKIRVRNCGPGILTLMFAVFAMLCTLTTSAQTITGTVSGLVMDPSGAAVAGAKVVATNSATGVATVTTTNSAGIYSVRFLQIGQYTVVVEAPGFSKESVGPFSLEIDQAAKRSEERRVGKECVP